MFQTTTTRRLFLSLLPLLLFTAFSTQRAQAAQTRDVTFTLKAPHGSYKAELFKVGAARPTKTVDNIHPAGGIIVRFVAAPTEADYFIRVTVAEDGSTRQPGSFRLKSQPFWAYDAGTISW